MTTDEHLDLILKRCTELLAIAEKRTQGEWEVDTNRIIANVTAYMPSRTVCGAFPWGSNDMEFIASCAGSAEAGWKATIAAIETAKYFSGVTPLTCEQILNDIIAAWTIETLKP